MNRSHRWSIAAATLLMACARSPMRSAPLVADRPDFTEADELASRGMVQAEGGSTIRTIGADRDLSLGELLLRIGVAEGAELRLALNSVAVSRAAGERSTRLEDPGIGAKVMLLRREEGAAALLPQLALIGMTTLPVGKDDDGGRSLVPEAKLAAEWEVSRRVGLGANATLARPVDAGERVTEFGGSAVLGVELTDRLSAYGEYFNSFVKGDGTVGAHYGNVGLTLGITSDLQLDARIGAGGPRDARERFLGIGFARRW